MRRILEDIKTGTFSHVYLLCGSEDYLRVQYKNKLRDALLGDADKMNLSEYEGSGVDPLAVIDMAQTMPFFAERRVMLLENTGFFKSSQEALASYMKEIPEFTYFIFVEKELDKRSRMYKAVKEVGHIAEFETQDEATLRKWIARRVENEKKKMNMSTISLFLSRTGSDMENIEKELEKLICYTLHKEEITPKDIETITTRQLSSRVFDMVSLMAQKRQKEALVLYSELLSLRESTLMILNLMEREFNQLWQIKILRGKGYDERTIASAVGIPPFAVGKKQPSCNLYEVTDLHNALADCVQMEEDIKSGRMTDTIGVELLLIKYSTKEAAS